MFLYILWYILKILIFSSQIACFVKSKVPTFSEETSKITVFQRKIWATTTNFEIFASLRAATNHRHRAGEGRARGSGFQDLLFCTSDLDFVPADTINVAMTRYRPSFDQFCKRTPENRNTMKIINFHNFRLFCSNDMYFKNKQ